MPDTKPYHPGSFAYALQATANDLTRISERIRLAFESDLPPANQIDFARCRVLPEVERIDHQAAALREIARKQWEESRSAPSVPTDQWPTHVAVEPRSVADILTDVIGYPPVNADEDGPSWDDAPDEPRRR